MEAAALDAELIELHNDIAHAARLSTLHEAAAAVFEEDIGAQRFQITHAWVFAMVDGDEARTARLAAELHSLGGL